MREIPDPHKRQDDPLLWPGSVIAEDAAFEASGAQYNKGTRKLLVVYRQQGDRVLRLPYWS